MSERTPNPASAHVLTDDELDSVSGAARSNPQPDPAGIVSHNPPTYLTGIVSHNPPADLTGIVLDRPS